MKMSRVFLLTVVAAGTLLPQQVGRTQDVGSTQTAAPEAWAKHSLGITEALTVDLGHLGIHTHADFITFDTGATDVAAMEADGQNDRDVTVVGHSMLNTDHAALPPDYKDFAQSYGPVPNPYGPIDGTQHGKPGWSSSAYTSDNRHLVRFAVPTRFANWVAQQPAKTQKKFLNPRSYSLRVTWLQRQ